MSAHLDAMGTGTCALSGAMETDPCAFSGAMGCAMGTSLVHFDPVAFLYIFEYVYKIYYNDGNILYKREGI